MVPADYCQKRLVAPLSVTGKLLRLAVVNPLDYTIIQDIEFMTRRQVITVVASEETIYSILSPAAAISYEPSPIDLLNSINPAGQIEEVTGPEIEVLDSAQLANDTTLPPVIRLVNLILSEAAKEGASDIHIEPQEEFLQVRYRVDGLLSELLKIPKNLQDATLSRLKIISGLDISERRRPQDGRSSLRYEGKRIDLRVSTLPTHFGEKIVIRLLDTSKTLIAMEDLGLLPENLQLFQSWLSQPQGMVLVTGPTGSGKSTTLYTAINWLKSPSNSIVTVEDPVEYNLPGINQVPINTKADMTFATGLRSILRQDPNIILVGEIRDQETAGIALKAAQTGHLLLSTLHTNDAPATITRMLDLGVEPFLVASSLTGVLAQRLVRRVCPSCVIAQPPNEDAVKKIGGPNLLPANAKWVAGRGCANCRQSGYKGRLAIHELLSITDEVRELIGRRAPEHVIRKVAYETGFRALLEDGLAKAAQGLTTVEEVLRFVAHNQGITSVPTTPVAAPIPPPKVIALPAEPPLLPLLPLLEEHELNVLIEIVEPTQAMPAADEAQPRVLVVEDNETVATVVQYFLELEGFKVLLAENGRIGLEMALRDRPDIIVSDIFMPELDGLALTQELRANPATRDIAIILLTSENTVEGEAQGLAVGADDYLTKPVEPRRLAARIKSLLARSTRRMAATE